MYDRIKFNPSGFKNGKTIDVNFLFSTMTFTKGRIYNIIKDEHHNIIKDDFEREYNLFIRNDKDWILISTQKERDQKLIEILK